jgi:hypothetical protein
VLAGDPAQIPVPYLQDLQDACTFKHEVQELYDEISEDEELIVSDDLIDKLFKISKAITFQQFPFMYDVVLDLDNYTASVLHLLPFPAFHVGTISTLTHGSVLLWLACMWR